ncbi:MAG: 16S rRNA (guanine(966)-N(2))-methyltransferase RsmD [Gammaproteobacteria bacterium]|jgi:16S rRNA (guanine966-N2)-methyltransferase
MAQQRRSGTLRIIGGAMRGRKIRFHDAAGLRPTLDRVRETLFNWLATDIRDARCLDLFAGSGALSFEALSRGAAQVVAVEKSSVALRDLHKNRNVLGTRRLTIVHGDALRYLDGEHRRPFDVIFVDPPFGRELVQATLRGLTESDCLTSRTLVYVEHEAGMDLAHEGWDRLRHKRAGNTEYTLLERIT